MEMYIHVHVHESGFHPHGGKGGSSPINSPPSPSRFPLCHSSNFWLSIKTVHVEVVHVHVHCLGTSYIMHIYHYLDTIVVRAQAWQAGDCGFESKAAS